MRIRNGKRPPTADGLIFDGDNGQPGLEGWRLYRRAESRAPWLSLKLVSVAPRAGAANYWTAYHVDERRLNRSRGTLRIQPELRAALELELARIAELPAEDNPLINPPLALSKLRGVDVLIPATRSASDAARVAQSLKHLADMKARDDAAALEAMLK